MALTTLRQLLNKLFIIDKWNIGYVYQTPECLISSRKIADKVHWLPECTADYAADPFAVPVNDKLYLYYEELRFWKGKGTIMMTDGLSFLNKKQVNGLPGDLHLSYPFLFIEDGTLYCIPETAKAGEIALYRAASDHMGNFTKVSVLAQGKAFVDSSLIFYQNRYWLFSSISGSYGDLYIFYSDTLTGTFKAHAQNPVKVPDNISRSAGTLFISDGKLYRPSQNPQNNYGGSVTISEITELDEKSFSYKTVMEVDPVEPYAHGLHTLNFAGHFLIIDGKRQIFSLINPAKKIIRKLKRARKTC
jgi:hypothetical protein